MTLTVPRASVRARTPTSYLLIQDNLDAQKQPEYLDELKKLQTDDHKVPPNNTDETQPVDDGVGRAIKIFMGKEETTVWHAV